MSKTSLRTVLAAITIAGTVHFSHQSDLLVDFTRPVVLGSLSLLGIEATESGESIAVGHLDIPWTRDCSGINLLLILMALAVWVNRQEKSPRRFILRVLAMIPAALLANVLRVLTLISYRTLLYPAVESPQTHYFMGFIWLVPFIILITPRDRRPRIVGGMETLHAAAIISLLAPMSGAPNATLVSLAAVIGLSQCRMRDDHLRTRQWLMLLWTAAGIGIGLVKMESFWLSWLLTCPLLADTKWLLRLQGMLFLACTHPMVAMQPWSWSLAAGGALAVWISYQNRGGTKADPSRGAPPTGSPANLARRSADQRFLMGSRSLFLASIPLPFLASTLLSFNPIPWQPPAGLDARIVNQNGYEIKLPGQMRELGLICYFSDSRDRHHTLSVCLKYRGIELEEVGDHPLVMTEGRHWYREFFFQNGKLHSDYPAYIRSSFRPFSDPGLHLIFVSLQEAHAPAEFSALCEQFANEFAELSTGETSFAQE